MADKDFKVKSGLDLGTPLPLTEGGTGQTSASNALNALLPVQTDNTNKVLQTNGTTTSWVTLPNGFQKGDTASRPGSPALGDIYSNTQTGYIEVYTAAGWSQLGVIPTSATSATATDVGTSIAFGSGAATVAFTAGSGGGLASSFTAVSTPGSFTGAASSSPITVSGLTQGTSYTFTVTATNGYGNALASSSSNSITATSVPQAPTVGTPTNVTGIAFSGTTSASVPVTANGTGGKAVSGFTVTSSPGSLTASGGSPVTVTGLTAGTAYTFTAVATNANGNSTSSSASSSLTPSTVPDRPIIGTATVVNATTVSLTFTAPATGSSNITSYTATASPALAVTTAAGTTSPLTITGSFAVNTAYTFTLVANNANGSSLSSTSASNSVQPNPQYALLLTANSTQNYSWPSGYSRLRAFVTGGGGGGGAGTSSFNAGAGGGSGAMVDATNAGAIHAAAHQRFFAAMAALS